jgi:hypothetical protein
MKAKLVGALVALALCHDARAATYDFGLGTHTIAFSSDAAFGEYAHVQAFLSGPTISIASADLDGSIGVRAWVHVERLAADGSSLGVHDDSASYTNTIGGLRLFDGSTPIWLEGTRSLIVTMNLDVALSARVTEFVFEPASFRTLVEVPDRLVTPLPAAWLLFAGVLGLGVLLRRLSLA